MKTFFALFILFVISLVPAAGQERFSDKPVKFPQYEFRFFPDYRGTFEKSLNEVFDPDGYGYDMKQENLLREKVKRTIQAFESYKPLNPPRGLKARLYALTEVRKFPSSAAPRLSAMLDLYLFSYAEDENGKPSTAGETANWITLYYNNPALLTGTPVLENIYCTPLKTGNFFGHSVYETGRGEITLLTNSRRPLYIPVSQEEFLYAMINSVKKKRAEASEDFSKEGSNLSAKEEYKKGKKQRLDDFKKAYAEILRVDKATAAEYKKDFEQTEKELEAEMESNPEMSVKPKSIMEQGDEFYRITLKSLTEELNSLSPAERKKQAYYSTAAMEENISGLVNEGNPDGEPLIKINPDLFNSKLPQSEVQFIIVNWHGLKPSVYDGSREGYNLEKWFLTQLSKDESFWKSILNILSK